MMKNRFLRYLLIVSVVMILIFLPLNENVSNETIKSLQKEKKSVYNNNQGLGESAQYVPRNITPKNASFHPSESKFTIEWWYFEGIFENGYNAVVNIILLSKRISVSV